jgi:hypothetical protein
LQVTFHHHPHLSIWSTSDAAFAAARKARMVTDVTLAAA